MGAEYILCLIGGIALWGIAAWDRRGAKKTTQPVSYGYVHADGTVEEFASTTLEAAERRQAMREAIKPAGPSGAMCSNSNHAFPL